MPSSKDVDLAVLDTENQGNGGLYSFDEEEYKYDVEEDK